jgi:hypothetical protein
MATDWDSVKTSLINAAKGVLGGTWSAASTGVTAQVASLVQIAQYVEQNKGNMTPEEVSHLGDQQKLALQVVLTTYEAIGLALAQNAVAAVFTTLLQAVPVLAGFA